MKPIDIEGSLLVLSLRIAADQYAADAAVCRANGGSNMMRRVSPFLEQAQICRDVATRVDDANPPTVCVGLKQAPEAVVEAMDTLARFLDAWERGKGGPRESRAALTVVRRCVMDLLGRSE